MKNYNKKLYEDYSKIPIYFYGNEHTCCLSVPDKFCPFLYKGGCGIYNFCSLLNKDKDGYDARLGYTKSGHIEPHSSCALKNNKIKICYDQWTNSFNP